MTTEFITRALLKENLGMVVILNCLINQDEVTLKENRGEIVGILEYNEVIDIYSVYNVNATTDTNFMIEQLVSLVYNKDRLKITLV